MTTTAKKVLSVQRAQFEMGLKWISIIEDPANYSFEDRMTAVEQLGIVNESIATVISDIANFEITL